MRQYTQIWAVPSERITAYLNNCGSTDDNITFVISRDVYVSVESLPDRNLGKLSIPQTKVVFWGHEKDLYPVIEAFRLEFLSGGG